MRTRSSRSSSFPELPSQVPITHRHRRSASYTEQCKQSDIQSAESLARTILRQARAKLSSQNVDTRAFIQEHFKSFLPAESLARTILRQARAKLSSQNVDTRAFIQEHFKSFLPAETDNERVLSIFRSWIAEPLLVPDSDLRQILRCQISLKGSRRMKQTTVCYFRSWTMTSKQLQSVLLHLDEQKYIFERAQYWMNVARGASADTTITVRYVGKTAFPSSPYSRFNEDLTKGRGSLLFRVFLSNLKTLFPAIYQGGCSYLVNDSVLQWFSKDCHKLEILGDRYERFLICFFNPRSLLNQQQGGNSIDFVPPVEDENLFVRCRTSFATKIRKLLRQMPQGEWHQIQGLFNEVNDWIETNGSRSDAMQTVNKNYLNALCRQGTPYSFHNHTIVVFCGLAVSAASFSKGVSFFQGRSKSASFIAQFLDNLVAWELEDRRQNSQKLLDFFTFNNLYNWSPALREDVWTASEFLRRWLEIVRPLVAVTLGHISSGVVSSNFHGRSRLGNNTGYLRHVGHARIAHFLDPKLKPEENLLHKSAFILIPHIHPGFDARGTQFVVQRRLYLLTYILTWTYLDTATDAVSVAYDNTFDRQNLCEQIMKRAETRLMDAGFWSAFDRAKTEMRETWRVLRVNDTRRRDQAKRPNQHAPDARRRRPTADRISAGYKTVDESLSKLPVPKPIIKDEPENRLHEGSDGLELVNDFVDDSFAPRSSSHGGPDEFEFTNVLADNIHEPKNPAKKPFSDLSHGSSVRFKFCVSEYCGMRTFDSPSGPMPPINMDFINIFAHNFWEPGVWKKSHASEIRQEMADEEGNECLFEDDDDHGSHSTSHAGLDEHASYQREFILAIGRSQRASGSPDSSMRLRQARNLWKAGIGGLHEHFERVDSHRGAWESFILQQPTEYWLLGCFAAIEEPQTMCPGKRYILSSFLPASATADSLDNFEHRRGAFQLACDQYNERQTQWMASMTQRKKYKGTFRCVQQVDGSEVDVNVSSHMTIWCRGGDGQELGIWLTVPRSACPYTWLDKRTVHFNRYGIDIRDENFSRCLSWAGHASATIPKDRFVTAGNRSELISLWESVTCLEYGPINQVLEKNQRSRQIGATARKYGPAGRPLLPTMTYMQVLNQRNYRTCLNDALWLLKEYLDFYYPNGGDFWTGSKEDFPKGNGDIERFMSFLGSSEYSDHPYTEKWIKELSSYRKLKSVNFGPLLTQLRQEIVVIKRQEWHKDWHTVEVTGMSKAQ